MSVTMDIPKAQSHTPLMKQYWEIKSQHLDKILLFRMGDFYEMFFDDAIKAAPVLNIALTSRSKGQEVPMCGVPHHSVGPQINKLLAQGLKVAICDQLESPQEGKKIVRRGVTRVVTPGLVYDPDTLESTVNNYVAAIVPKGKKFDFAALDISTGELFQRADLSPEDLQSIVGRLNPQEFLLPQAGLIETSKLVTLRELSGSSSAAEYLIQYAVETQGEGVKRILQTKDTLDMEGLLLPPQTLRHLEIFKRLDGSSDATLCWAVDLTRSAVGSRLLRRRLSQPFTKLENIEAEYGKVERFVGEPQLRSEIRGQLRTVGDLERRVGRLINPLCNGRDLRSLADALLAVDRLWSVESLQQEFPLDVEKIRLAHERIFETLREDLPYSTREGGLIRQGVNSTLDEYVDLDTHAQSRLSDLENRERQKTGINSLKIKYNSIFGYSIEVTKSNLEKVPNYFVRKQTIAQGERFITDELKALEDKILSAQQKRYDLEYDIFQDLKEYVLKGAPWFFAASAQVGHLDVVTGFAELAAIHGYSRPQFWDGGYALQGSRHPVLEKSQKDPFIPNDISLKESQCLLLTGPNMAGKSTLMRQIALTSILAQAGSFVPASSSRLPLLNQIFTRLGAHDDVSQGLSTFMVEMTETAEIIRMAKPGALVILDEIGRGTSTYDGLSLAQAVLEYFCESAQAYTLFATHYHELTTLAEDRPQILNGHMSIKEHKGQLVFLRKLQMGPAGRSYGIDVAKLAGLPKSLTDRAQGILEGLVLHARELQTRQLSLLDQTPLDMKPNEEESKLLQLGKSLKDTDLNRLTPHEAMNRLFEWQSEIQNLDI